MTHRPHATPKPLLGPCDSYQLEPFAVEITLPTLDTVVEMIGPKKTFSFFYGLEMLIAGVE